MTDTPSPAREPAHSRLAGLLERAFNPIMLKELRASLRGTRFFVSHLVILCLFAAGILLAFLTMIPSRPGSYEDSGDPSAVGRSVFRITQLLQLGIAFLVVPGLAATSISSERESLTHDLLLTTTMTARQIVWGKFTAAMTQAFTLFVSMVPLVSLCFLFGGLTLYQILANYAFLFGLSAVMIAFALSMSANARTTQRAVGSVYGLTFLGGIVMSVLIGSGWGSEISDGLLVAYGFGSTADYGHAASMDILSRVLYIHLVPGFLWMAMMSLFFINATNRLKPHSANRSTPLRIYFAAVVFGAGGIAVLSVRHSMPESTPADERSLTLMTYSILTLTVSLLGALFACEEPFPAPHLAREAASLTGWRRALRILGPGSESGAAFTLLTVSLLLAASFAAYRTYTRDFDRGAWTGCPPWMPLAVAFLMVVGWTVFTSTLARWLSALMPGRPLLLRTLLVLSSLFLALFPLIHWAIAEAIDRDLADIQRKNGPITLAFSPIMAVLSSLDLSSGRRDFPLYAGPVPVCAGFAAFSVLGGLIFHVLGTRARSKLCRELEAESRASLGPDEPGAVDASPSR